MTGAAKLTDVEWREFQNIPDQGYSHRAWVDHKIAERADAAYRQALKEAAAAIRENAGPENDHGICEGVSNWPQDRGSAYSTATSEALEVIADLLGESR